MEKRKIFPVCIVIADDKIEKNAAQEIFPVFHRIGNSHMSQYFCTVGKSWSLVLLVFSRTWKAESLAEIFLMDTGNAVWSCLPVVAVHNEYLMAAQSQDFCRCGRDANPSGEGHAEVFVEKQVGVQPI